MTQAQLTVGAYLTIMCLPKLTSLAHCQLLSPPFTRKARERSKPDAIPRTSQSVLHIETKLVAVNIER